MYLSMSRAPAQKRRGPGLRDKNTIYRQVRRVVVSAPAAIGGVGCEDRISVTGDHLSFDGNCGVRSRVQVRLGDGRSNGVRALPFLCFRYLWFCRAARRRRSPTRLHGPVRVRRTVLPGRALNQHRPLPARPDLELRQGLTCHFHVPYLPCCVRRALPPLCRASHEMCPGPA